MTFEQAAVRLFELAKENGGTVTAAQVENDPALATAAREVVTAAAHMLAGGTNVFPLDASAPREWFPYAGLSFRELH